MPEQNILQGEAASFGGNRLCLREEGGFQVNEIKGQMQKDSHGPEASKCMP